MIEAKNLSCGFKESILSNINISFEPAEIVIIMGANGVGKSCLLQTLAGVIPSLKGQVLNLDSSYHNRARQISYAAQDAIQNSSILVGDYLALVAPINENFKSQLIESLELLTFMDKPLAFLSGGQRQKARLVATLIQDAQSYLLDEPTNSLDPKPVDGLTNCLRSIASCNKNVIIVTHDLMFALQVGTRFIGLKNESLLFDCKIDSLRSKQYLDILFDRKFRWHEVSDGEWSIW